ncbi:HAD family hydrolase [Angustibacter sp. McL0619]|uniref:HAD family hydrolase n=1 Tax=Angustibacter sp. McL0619 TaxID=3415676 RepID=UPI003CEF6CF9
MPTSSELLPSWRPGATRDAVVGFLDAAAAVPLRDRLACLDNEGTLWCERPTYVQFDFFVDALKTRAGQDPNVAEVPEFAALLTGDRQAIATIGLERIATALAGLFAGLTPAAFNAAVQQFMARATHPTLGRPSRSNTYQPMLELVEALRRLDFTVAVVTGGGTEFVRAISQDLYGVPPEAVVGTLIEYEYRRGDDGSPSLLRSTGIIGAANEGSAKLANIQTQLGRRPIFAAGNSGGDREMLEWAVSGDGPSLALLVDHDDEAREFKYVSSAETFAEPEPITDVGRRLGWTVVSMADDWATVFAD